MSQATSFEGTSSQIHILDNEGFISASTAVTKKNITIMDDGAQTSTISSVYARSGNTTKESMSQEVNTVTGEGQQLAVKLFSDTANNMQNVLSISPIKTSMITSGPDNQSNTVSFDVDGVCWSNSESALYLGGKMFRLKVSKDGLNKDTLSIEALNQAETDYEVKFQVARS